jgi:hypothetical protein
MNRRFLMGHFVVLGIEVASPTPELESETGHAHFHRATR